MAATAAARVTGYSNYWVGQIARRYNRDGPDGVRDQRHTTEAHPRMLLSEREHADLRTALAEPHPSGARATGPHGLLASPALSAWPALPPLLALLPAMPLPGNASICPRSTGSSLTRSRGRAFSASRSAMRSTGVMPLCYTAGRVCLTSYLVFCEHQDDCLFCIAQFLVQRFAHETSRQNAFRCPRRRCIP